MKGIKFNYYLFIYVTIHVAYFRVIENMYIEVTISARIELCQGLILYLYVYLCFRMCLLHIFKNLCLNACFLHIDIVLIGKSRKKINEKLENYKQAKKACGFCLSRSKTKYIAYKFCKRFVKTNIKVKNRNHIILQVINHRIQVR